MVIDFRALAKRVVVFIAEFLPAQKAHFFFLLPTLLLLCATSLPWIYRGPGGFGDLPPELESSSPIVRRLAQGLLLLLPDYLVLFAGLACLWRTFAPSGGTRRKFGLGVFVPALAGLALPVAEYFASVSPPRSVLETPFGGGIRTLGSLPDLLFRLGPGSHAVVAALILLGVGVWKYRRDQVTLPVRFLRIEGEVTERAHANPIARPLLLFTVFSVVLTTLSYFANACLFFLLRPTFPTNWRLDQFFWWEWVEPLIPSAVPAMCAWYFLGRDSGRAIRKLFRWRPGRDLLVAVGVPAGVMFASIALYYFSRQVLWHFQRPDALYPPEFSELVHLPQIWCLLLLVPALLEEIAWRGYLQPRLIAQFGLRRAIFVLGLIWGIWHFPGVAGGGSGDVTAALAVLGRLAVTVLLSIPLAWLVLRSGSVLPAALMHGMNNVVVRARLLTPQDTWTFLSIAGFCIWGLASYWLFKRFPPQAKE